MKTVIPAKVCSWLYFFTLLAVSCKPDNEPGMVPLSAQQQEQVAGDNNNMMASMQDVASVTSDAFLGKGIATGRVLNHRGSYIDCGYSVTDSIRVVKKVDSLMYSGSITIDFGNGTGCHDSTMRKGEIRDVFDFLLTHGDSSTIQSNQTISFDEYQQDTLVLDGSITIQSPYEGPVVMVGKSSKIKYKDGTFLGWNGSLRFACEGKGGFNWFGENIDLTGSWNGTTRSGVAYTATITKPIVLSWGCQRRSRPIPTEGTLEITVGGVTSTIDYGDGHCDNKYTVTLSGVTTTVSLN
jgi:hypothetical protein